MGKYQIAVLPGDGIGPEITDACDLVLEKLVDVIPNPFARLQTLLGGCRALSRARRDAARQCDERVPGSRCCFARGHWHAGCAQTRWHRGPTGNDGGLTSGTGSAVGTASCKTLSGNSLTVGRSWQRNRHRDRTEKTWKVCSLLLVVER